MSEKLRLILAFHFGTWEEDVKENKNKVTNEGKNRGGEKKKKRLQIESKAKHKIAVVTCKSIFQMYKMCYLDR